MTGEISFREAGYEDCRMFYGWRNDEVVRSVSFDRRAISFDTHEKWFSGKLEDEACRMFVILADGDPAGQVRFDTEGPEAVISISIDKDFRGRALGTRAIRTLSGLIVKKYGVSKIRAYIKKNNIASLKAFERAGYRLIDESDTVNGQPACRMEYDDGK